MLNSCQSGELVNGGVSERLLWEHLTGWSAFMSIVGEASKSVGSCRSEYVVQGESVMQLERLSICQSRRQKMLW